MKSCSFMLLLSLFVMSQMHSMHHPTDANSIKSRIVKQVMARKFKVARGLIDRFRSQSDYMRDIVDRVTKEPEFTHSLAQELNAHCAGFRVSAG